MILNFVERKETHYYDLMNNSLRSLDSAWCSLYQGLTSQQTIIQPWIIRHFCRTIITTVGTNFVSSISSQLSVDLDYPPRKPSKRISNFYQPSIINHPRIFCLVPMLAEIRRLNVRLGYPKPSVACIGGTRFHNLRLVCRFGGLAYFWILIRSS